ncbi:MAG: penicillin-binding protein 2, partial [Streptosporangiales bacterium]|nr:penicillin-binding protein 2 [Streptosporangiales bacterium]
GEMYAPITGYYTLYNSSGIEHAENPMLSGEDDRLFVRRITDLFQGTPPEGASIQLTVNPKAQRAAYDGLQGHKGAAVAINPKTGAILAMATSPSFDPNKLAGHDDKAVNKAYQRLATDSDQPLLNRSLRGRYPPGSTFKLITSAAALSSGKYNPGTDIPSPSAYRLPGTRTYLHNFGGEVCGDGVQQSLKDALTISCNTAFAKLGAKLGDGALRTQAQKFGFGQSFDVPMASAQSVFPASPDASQTALSAIGQYDVSATPLQMAMVSASIANGGTVMKPYLVDQVKAPDLKVIQQTAPAVYDQAVSPQVAGQLTTMMRSVVEHGTGTNAQIPGTAVAGKTGTAQHGTGQSPHAWFTGFAPAGNPQVAVAVIVEDGGSMGSEATGGAVAAPIAKAMMRAVINR